HNLLIIRANELSHPVPLKPLDYWMRVATNFGWNEPERELIEPELLRDKSQTLKHLDGFGFVTNTGRKVSRLQLRQDGAPREEPWRQRFLEKLPAIQGGGQ